MKDDFDNGEMYYQLEGRKIVTPVEATMRPSKAALTWHAEIVFRQRAGPDSPVRSIPATHPASSHSPNSAGEIHRPSVEPLTF